MTVRMVTTEPFICPNGDCEFFVTDGTHHAAGRIKASALDQARAESNAAIVSLIGYEFAGALYVLDARQRNVPYLGMWARRKGTSERQQILGINHGTGVVRLGENEGVHWAECEYV